MHNIHKLCFFFKIQSSDILNMVPVLQKAVKWDAGGDYQLLDVKKSLYQVVLIKMNGSPW